MQVQKLIGFVILSATLYYIYYLEREHCKCVMDWRHDFIKYYSWGIILLPIIMALAAMLLVRFHGIGFMVYFIPVILGVIIILGFINLYALYTYIGDLNNTGCACAITDLKYINTFLYYWRYVMVAGYTIAILLMLLSAGSVINLVKTGKK